MIFRTTTLHLKLNEPKNNNILFEELESQVAGADYPHSFI